MTDYATAYELFEAARDAAQQNDSMRRRIERMELAEQRSSQGEPISRGSIGATGAEPATTQAIFAWRKWNFRNERQHRA